MSSINLIHARTILFLFLLGMVNFLPLQAQEFSYCSSNNISGVSWSPNGEQLAVLTVQGVHIYDQNLELIRSIVVPRVPSDSRHGGRIAWSPDSQWIITPNRVPVEYLNMGGIGGIWSIVNTTTEEILTTRFPDGVVELVWSPDNRFIATLYYESQFGINLPYSDIRVSAGINEEQIEPQTRHFEGLHFRNLAWNEADVFTAQVDGITLSFDRTNVEHTTAAPIFYPSWWVGNHDGTQEAAYKPDTFFYVRDVDSDERRVEITPVMYLNDEFIAIGIVDKIYWLADNRHLIGLYPRTFRFEVDHPDLQRILQGIVVDAQTATELNHFLIYADNDIEGFSISQVDGRIAIALNDTQVELWDVYTEARLTVTEVPLLSLTGIGYCPE